MAMKQFKLPDVGEGLTEAEIVKWHVAAGDTVETNQTIVEIETAKAIVELPCPFEGVVASLDVAEGVTVDVGTPIITVEVAGPADNAGRTGGAAADVSREDLVPSPAADPGTHVSPTVGPDPAGDGAAGGEPKRQPVLVGYGVKPGATKRRPRRGGHPQPVDIPVPQEPGMVMAPARTASGPETAGRALAKPPVRKMAKDLGVDISTLTGSGPQGTITRDDVQAALGTPAPVASDGREERVPIKGVRKHTAAAMVRSAFTAPHVTEFLQVDVTETMAAVRRLRELADFAEVKVSPLLLVARALLTAVRRHPMVNSAWDEAAQEIVVKHYVNLGIAAATERGLIVPNIKDAQDLSLPELARALQGLAQTARAGKAQPADLSGGTITITNVGVFGVDTGTPILTPGESAILAFGQIRDMPWVHDGEIKVRKVTTLALSFDHRIVDGELGSLFLRDIGAMLEDPLRMLAWS
jgi:2-oxoisovalerate dehydrogenase E2 component (dihydrolipoyl transacylase)